ncbi:hypothetical protein ABQF39_25820 [Mycobacterium syngnathidarum]
MIDSLSSEKLRVLLTVILITRDFFEHQIRHRQRCRIESGEDAE